MAIVYHLPVRQSPATPETIAAHGMLLAEAGFLPEDAALFGLPPQTASALATAMAAHADAGVRAVWEASR